MSALAAGVLLTTIAVGALAPIIRAAPSDAVGDKRVKTAQAGAVPPAGQPKASPAAKVNADRLAKAKADRAAKAKIRKARSAAAAAKASSARKAAAAKKAAASKRALQARKKNGRKPRHAPRRGPVQAALPPRSAPTAVAMLDAAPKAPPPTMPVPSAAVIAPAARPRTEPDAPLVPPPSVPEVVAQASTDAAPASFAAGRPAIGPMAQFQLPSLAGPSGGPARPVTQFLTHQYSIGSESDITYRKNRDLDSRLRDDFLLMAPQINGYILYRPNDSTEMLAEGILERELPVREEPTVTLPDGTTQLAPRRYTTAAVDQAWVKFKGVGPFDVTVGRRNFEDERHWLYDTSLDAVHARTRWQDFTIEASVARKDRVDGDLIGPVQKGRIDRAMLYGDYRGIEDIKLAGYAIKSRDRAGQEGQPLHLGLRAYGTPSDRFSFWSEFAWLRGKDEAQRDFSAHAADLGALYRFPELPLHPGITLGYAYGSGDAAPNDATNKAFRQTGLQSNEVKGAGVAKFKYYGEALDPELSNLRILTAGLGFRPAQNVYVDLLYHRYRLNAITDELRNADTTAQMNQDPAMRSRDVGNAFDVVVGLRNLFGVRRFGVDLRAGVFDPGQAFRNPAGPVFGGADKSVSALFKFWW